MGRPANHRITNQHPSPRFRDKVRLHCFLRGPDDDTWAAQYLVGGRWLPRNSASLGTRDFDEACERARDKYALAVAGQPITEPRATTKKSLEHAFQVYAELAITKLIALADAADREIAPGKGHKYHNHVRHIRRDLLPRWGETDIRTISSDDLNEWVVDSYRVHGGKPATVDTLGNLDQAFRQVWLEAVAAKVVGKDRPMIDKNEHGADGTTRAFIDAEGVKAVARLMTDDWVAKHGGHKPAFKRLLRAYIALAATTGIRPGMELKRIKLGHIAFKTQKGTPVIIIWIEKNQGKHKRSRPVVVYEGDVVPIRWLLSDLIAYRRSQEATDHDALFAWPDGSFPTYPPGVRTVLTEASVLRDPMTGKERSAYSFRHYFATLLIEQGHSVAQVADWLGTSSQMIEQHYNRFLTERHAHKVNGYDLRQMQIEREIEEVRREPWDADADAQWDIRDEF
jgi:integrase